MVVMIVLIDSQSSGRIRSHLIGDRWGMRYAPLR
jgi:hypothetical protein